jgi:hypothetical protein
MFPDYSDEKANNMMDLLELSGGERFSVSLALALGLSQIAGRSVFPIFLVNPDAETLKEHIAAQIEVVPQENGRSLINAPGCTCNTD